ncbi:peptidoglycan DD-metalloendopeptidase family protein [Marinobacterium jannaschii]|uniref:peptidoglycan DD-metalloendopeptidase family protein n=1 Tax=Marinobacterium jannaschii TaxID=64970 RepID=UPI000AA83025|nr:peptidoglycan DD-metalloendopeptidase family protein [Marinobacterium jannaschii]
MKVVTSVLNGFRSFVVQLPRLHKILLLLAALILSGALVSPSSSAPERIRKSIELPLSLSDAEAAQALPAPEVLVAAGQDAEPEHEQSYIVRKGDTLSKIFEVFRIPQATMYKLLEADLDVLALDTIRPGHRLEFDFNDKQLLTRFTFKSGLTYKVVFSREKVGSFEVKEHIAKGQWRREVFAGEVHGSFHLSAKKAGTTLAEAYSITTLLKERVKFRRDARAGDKFQVVVSRQYVKDQPTGNSKVEGFRYQGKTRTLSAFLFNESYYDEKGRSLEKAFQRIPLKKRYRISSSFNPRRRHPITKKIRPHNGTDFPLRIGTPVLSAGDGVVSRVIRHRYAGLYIEIKHGYKYRTRYLHLSKALVRKGQKVSRGQRIALSGNSGRSTGPHLHYEFHINNRPVNPMTAKIPVVKTIASSKKGAFRQQVARQSKLMQQLQAEQAVARVAENDAP